MAIKIYKDSEANAIFIEDANGVQFLNSLRTTVEDGVCTIHDVAKNIEIVSDVAHTDFVDQSDNTYGSTAVEVCDALNSLFASSGTSTGSVPSITSSLAITMVQGQTLNYELIADYGVGYEWDLSGVAGVTTVEGNQRKLIGGSGLTAGTYNIPVKAINYNGEDSETLVLTVDTPAFANTKSMRFSNFDYLSANASSVQNILGRSGNGSGSADAWTVAFYFKPSYSNNNFQFPFYYGSSDVNNGNHIRVRYTGTSSKTFWFEYGSSYNYLRHILPNNTFTDNTWHHVMITYDGGTTGTSAGSINDYHSRFTIFVDGVTPSGILKLHGNNGNSAALTGQNFHIARYDQYGYLHQNTKVDEFAIWDSDQSSNVASIYNGGAPHDLSLLGTAPNHWWRMGDGDTYPTVSDHIGSVDFTMNNMTAADIVNDVPA